MSKLPMVSIISVCYNHERFLDDYFKGILGQTYPNIELILFDDGSKDGSWEKICSYLPALQKRFKHLAVERHDNMGIFKEKTLGLKAAKGELICPCATDDYYLPTKVEENVKYLIEHPEVGLVHSDFDKVVNETIQQGFWKSQGIKITCENPFEDLLLAKYYIVPFLTCIRKELLLKHVDFIEYESKGYAMEDVPMLLDLANHTRFGYIDKPLARYRIVEGSMAHPRLPKKLLQFIKSVHQARLDYIDKFHISEDVRQQALKACHVDLYHLGYDNCLKEECLESYVWLLKNYSNEYGAYFHKISAFSTSNKLLWKVVKFFQDKQILHSVKELIKSVLAGVRG